MAWSWSNIDWTSTGTVAAAWVQAIGSIGAIMGAAAIAGRESREALGREERERARLRELAHDNLIIQREMAAALIDTAHLLLGQAGKALRDAPLGTLTMAAQGVAVQFEACERRLLSYPVERLGSLELVVQFAAAQMQITLARAYCNYLASLDPVMLLPAIYQDAANQIAAFQSATGVAHARFVEHATAAAG